MKYRSKIQLYNVDCLEYMKQCEDNQFDLAIVDPPYGININMNMGRKKGKKKVHTEKNWDNSIPSKEYFDELKRVSKHQIVWGGNYMTEYLEPTGAWIFWDKGVPDGVSFADGELAWTSFSNVLKKLDVVYSGFQGMDEGGKTHPTQKPVKLYRHLLNEYAEEGNKILDTHLGSGSIAIACDSMGFDLVGCEIDKEYFDAALKRLQPYRDQQTLF